MEEAGLLLIADAVARPTGDDAVIELWLGRVLKRAAATLGREVDARQQNGVAAARYQHCTIACG